MNVPVHAGAATRTIPELFRVMTGEPVPTIETIAVGLSTPLRWLNRTIRPWSTLQHVLACEIVAAATDPLLRLALLFHDTEDMIGNDVPLPAKTDAQRDLERQIRRYAWEKALGLPYPDDDVWAQVRYIDQALMLAEADVLVAPRLRDIVFEEVAPAKEHAARADAAADVVVSMLDMEPREAVFVFTQLATEIRSDPRLRLLEGRV